MLCDVIRGSVTLFDVRDVIGRSVTLHNVIWRFVMLF